jgi:hypothetical protein
MKFRRILLPVTPETSHSMTIQDASALFQWGIGKRAVIRMKYRYLSGDRHSRDGKMLFNLPKTYSSSKSRAAVTLMKLKARLVNLFR